MFFAGNEALTGTIKGLLGNSMFLGGLVAALLDNTVRGNVLCKLLRKKCCFIFQKHLFLTIVM